MKEKIEELVQKFLPDQSYFIVEIIFGGAENTRKVSVIIDGDNGVNIEDCAKISRKLGEVLESENLIDTAYLLEVSSPGVDKPLKLKRQYQKNKGRKLAVMRNDTTIHTGVLEEVTDENITIAVEEVDKANKKKKHLVKTVIPFQDIKKSNVIVSFK